MWIKLFGKKKVLENLNCNIQTNSIYGLIGANGAGKSTLLRIINDVFRKDSGEILIDGEEVENNEKVKQKLAFLPDDLYIVPGYTLTDMAKYYQAMYPKFDMNYLKELAEILKLNMNIKLDTFTLEPLLLYLSPLLKNLPTEFTKWALSLTCLSPFIKLFARARPNEKDLFPTLLFFLILN